MRVAVHMQLSTKADHKLRRYSYKKEECVNYITKRMGGNLRRLVKEYKGKKFEHGKGISKKGRLRNARIDAVQIFYRHTIRDNKGDVPKMSVEEWVILGLWVKPLHTDCSKGPKIWCSYQRDSVLGTLTYAPPKNPLPEAVVKL